MHYEKLTPEKFQDNLDGNKYKGSTGAKRAIGKADWPKAVKERLSLAVDKHYADEPKKAAKSTPEKKVERLRGRRKEPMAVPLSEVVDNPVAAVALASTTVETLTKALTFMRDSGSCDQASVKAGLESLAAMVKFIDTHVVSAIEAASTPSGT